VIVGVVLAAGASRRFGAQKLLAPVAGKAVVRWTVERMVASRLDAVIIVLGREADAVQRVLDGLTVRTVRNPRFADGLAASLVAGVDAMPPGSDAAVIALGDQPTVSTAVIDTLIDVWCSRRTSIVAPMYRGVRGNPVLFAHTVFAELRAGRGDRGARDVITRSADRVALVDVDEEMPVDVDEPTDLPAVALKLAAHTSRKER
jgi:molybdenum cofactor cytidylyltransferase